MSVLIIMLNGCLASSLYLLWTHRIKEMGRWVIYSTLFSLAEGLLLTVGTWVSGRNYMYMLEAGGRRTAKVWLLALALALTLAVLCYIVHRHREKKVIGACMEWGGHKILPYVAVKYFAVICVCLAGLGVAAEHTMIPYADWSRDDKKILSMNYSKLAGVSVDRLSSQYPLWKMGDIEILKGDGVPNILIIGDSFVWGDGYDNANYLWWNQLRRTLRDRGISCRIYAVGQCGASTADQLHWMRDTTMLEDIQPALIIVGYVTNDAQYVDENGRVFPSPQEDYIGDSVLTCFQRIFPNMSYLINNRLQSKMRQYASYDDWTGYPYEEWELAIVSGTHLERYQDEVIEPFGEFISQSGIPTFIVTNPVEPSREYYELRYENVLPAFEEAGLKVYNMLDDYLVYAQQPEHRKNLWINPVNSHPGTATAKFYSDYVADILERDYAELFGEKRNTDKTGIEKDVRINDWMPFFLSPALMGENSYVFYYPNAAEGAFLHARAGEDYVKLNFEEPVNLAEITIEGSLLERIKLWVTKEDAELGYDTQELFFAGSAKGTVNSFDVSEYERVTGICIHADMINGLADKMSVSFRLQ